MRGGRLNGELILEIGKEILSPKDAKVGKTLRDRVEHNLCSPMRDFTEKSHRFQMAVVASILPQTIELGFVQFSISDGVSDVAMAKVILNAAGTRFADVG